MQTKIFQSGNSQAIRIPKDFRFDVNVTEVEIFKRGDELVIKPKPTSLSGAFDLLSQMPDDVFPEGREDDAPQDRETQFHTGLNDSISSISNSRKSGFTPAC